MLLRRTVAIFFVMALLTSSAGVVAAQTRLKPGMNVFSLRDDVEIGRRSATQIERQYRTYNNARVSRIGRQLAARSGIPNLLWRFRVIYRGDANAFALPGGYIYVTSGMLRRMHNDSELAGVLAHEITHVTLRHGTNQASKAMLAQMPLQILGSRLGGGLVGNLAQLGLSFGLNSLFLKIQPQCRNAGRCGRCSVDASSWLQSQWPGQFHADARQSGRRFLLRSSEPQ